MDSYKEEPIGDKHLSLYSRKRWLAISCWVTNKWMLALTPLAMKSVTALSSKVLTSYASSAEISL